jgi:NAD+ diphosphatase
MKNLTSSFSISQKPKPDDLIVSINSRKEILFNKKNKNFFHKVPDQLPSQIFKIFEEDNLNIFLVEELKEINEECEYLSKKFLYSHLNENSLILISRAFQIYDWIYKQKFCSRTGNKLSEVREDLSKFCDSCTRDYFPKMSPCILAAITYNKKILLVKHNNEIRTLSTVIAGFVELGESLEDCVKREVFEEVGLKIKNIKYLASQSWPFPNQLMMAFSAEALNDRFEIDNNEILEANWYSKENLPQIPPEPSLSNTLILNTLKTMI